MRIILLLMMVLLFSVPAQADWMNGGMAQGQASNHAFHINAAPLPVGNVHWTRTNDHDQLHVEHQDLRYKPDRHDYLHNQTGYYTNIEIDAPQNLVVSPNIILPDGFEAVIVAGQTYYYCQGVFYQLSGDQLITIAPVIGAIVDSIPPGYSVVTVGQVYYFLDGGAYYVPVGREFQVVESPFAGGL